MVRLGFGSKIETVISIVVSCQGQTSNRANNAETLNVDLVTVENVSCVKLVLRSVWWG